MPSKYTRIKLAYIAFIILAYPTCVALFLWGAYNFIDFLVNPEFFWKYATDQLLISIGCTATIVIIVKLAVILRDTKRSAKYNL